MKGFVLRDYQKEASDAAVNFLRSNARGNGLIVAATGSGKSVIIADIASQLNTNVLVLQPTQEILLQNYEKLQHYGIDGGIYSASVGIKDIRTITFATIGSIMNHIDDFDKFGVIIADECHRINAADGQYKDFLEKMPRKVIGLTATPYRLTTIGGIETEGKFLINGTYDHADYFYGASWKPRRGVKIASRGMSKFLTRTKPRVFTDLIYNISVKKLMDDGYLARPEYYALNAFDETNVGRNSTGLDFDAESLHDEFKRADFAEKVANIVERLQHPKCGGHRKGILVFTRFVDDAEKIAAASKRSAVVSGETPPKQRSQILEDFKAGKIDVLTNAAILTTGYDRPDLDTVVIARPTLSLALYTQMVGRVLRVAKRKKTPWVVDLGGNLARFGRLEDTYITQQKAKQYQLMGVVGGIEKPLTNTLI